MASILVIEDDPKIREMLRMHLTLAGYSVRLAADATEGIQAILSAVPDLILSDVSLPYMDGFELLKALRGDETTRSIPVILLTGQVDEESYLRGLQLRATAYLTKPILRDDLLKSISAALGGATKDRKQV